MFVELKVLDKRTAVYEVSDETFTQMKDDFRTGGRTAVYDLASGGVARINWSEVTSLERHEEDPNRIFL